MQLRTLILPGLYDSVPGHWQSLWEDSHASFRRVGQRDWRTPDRSEWVATLQAAVAESAVPTILVAHSLGCSLVAHWAQAHRGPVQGALLVAPADVEAGGFPTGPTGFAPMPLAPLPFPSIVVASNNDPYVTLERAASFAGAWGAGLEIVGALGHINTESGLGVWPQGLALLDRLRRRK